MKIEEIIKIVSDQLKIDINSIHGIKHWSNVQKIGNYLLKYSGADKQVIDLFAYLHDSKRIDDNNDVNHGKGGAEYVQELYDQGILDITKKQFEQLKYAIRWHNNNNSHSEDVTIQTCWDSDRLDLWRCYIIPDPKRLFTDIAKEKKALNYSLHLNLE